MSKLDFPLDSRWLQARGANIKRVLVALHGMGDSMESFVHFRDELGVDDCHLLLLNAPDRYLEGYSWYPLEPLHRPSIRRNRQALLECVRVLEREGFATHNQAWVGHSQGGLMAVDLSLNCPRRLAGVVAVSSYIWAFRGWQQAAMSLRTPVLFTHGTHDRVLRLRETQAQVAALQDHGAPVSFRAFRKGHDFDMENEVGFIGRWVNQVWPPQRIELARRRRPETSSWLWG
jgi:phospholipase/carboxylesterase